MKLAVVGLVLALWAGAGASAHSAELHGNLTIASDYVNRGTDQSGSKPAIQGTIEVDQGSFYGQVFASTLGSHYDPSRMEFDQVLGYRHTIDGFNLDANFTHSLMIHNGRETSDEFLATVTHDYQLPVVGKFQPHVVLAYSPNYKGSEGNGFYEEFGVAKNLTDKLAVTGAWGHEAIKSGPSFSDWTIGGTYQLTKSLSLGLNYNDTDRHDVTSDYKPRTYVSLIWSF